MHVHRLALSFALCLPACTAHEDTTTPAPAARVEVKVASVQMIQNCSDPPADAAAETAAAAELANRKAAAPLAPAQAPAAGAPMPPDASMEKMAVGAAAWAGDGPGGWSPPCTQSTVQLSIANIGDREGKLHIDAIRMFDARSNKEVGKLEARKPSQWNPAGTYQPWNEVIVHGTTVKVGYRINEPDWSAVNTVVGTDLDPYARPYVLEIDVSVDGVSQTVRSPEFVREPVHMIVT
mgnify:CR=1 FL=1